MTDTSGPASEFSPPWLTPNESAGLDDVEGRGWVQWSDGTWGALGVDGFVVDVDPTSDHATCEPDPDWVISPEAGDDH
ncbi:hypothetical protein [Nocardia cyriacigeorgica]|uniref:Uncharacterized protein n=1 Tax=Nocardia cyriacigeorgica TaxID=135487 RepID=A0A5R8NHP3_9NOCA|nr:hypothetical protein [Nocardia cyriacigeorgica]TLF75212.1 hypothetical protein FEK34_20825 [Nocardia cyriacigeorgica]